MNTIVKKKLKIIISMTIKYHIIIPVDTGRNICSCASSLEIRDRILWGKIM